MRLQYLLALAAVIAAFLFFKNCSRTQKAIVEIKSTIQAPTGVAFIEVKDGIRQNVTGKIKVTFIDTAGKVMSANGIPLKTIDITSVMSIGLSPKVALSPDKPYLFYIKAEAEGYATNIKPVVITQNTNYYIPIYMVKLGALPSGGGLAATVGTSPGLIGSNLTIVAGTGAQALRITIPEGTRFSSNGKVINAESKLSFYLLRGNALDSNANLAFPGGFEVVKAVNDSGRVIVNPTAPAYFTTAGWFSMELKDETGQKVDAFSKPVDVEMPIVSGVINPNTQAVVKVGDRIPLWSMNEQTGIWKQGGETTVIDGGGGQLRANFKISHLSAWNLDYMVGGCPMGAGGDMTVNYNNPNNDFNGTYFSEFIRETDGVVLGSRVLTLNNASRPLTLIRAAANSRLYVHEGNDVATLLRGRTTVLNCGGTGTLGLLGSNSFPCVELEFKRKIDANPANDVQLCNMPVWYQEGSCASGYWYHGGATQAGIVKIPSAGNNTECLRFDFGNGGQVILPFEILYGGAGFETNKPGTATTPGGPVPFEYDYVISPTPGGVCSKRVVITIHVTAIMGLNNCP